MCRIEYNTNFSNMLLEKACHFGKFMSVHRKSTTPSTIISMNFFQFFYDKDPQPPDAWTAVWEATYEGSKPVQSEFLLGMVIGNENCLFVNVFTKQVFPEHLKPVLVWIHGGGYTRGSTSKDVYSPDYFMMKDIVVVTISYRLGLFGFLSLEDPSLKIPGNAGLRDQIFALKWIQNNISRFGGDPSNVTIFGQSAGAASVHLLGLTEKTEGLFHRMICMSGSAFCPWARTPRRDWPFRIAKELGYKGKNIDADVLKFLRSVNGKNIAAAEKIVITNDELYAGYLWCSYPVIEPYASDQCVIPNDPILMARNAWSNKIPMIAGYTSKEGIYFGKSMPPGILREWVNNPISMLPFDLKSDFSSEYCQRLGKTLRETFFGEEELTVNSYIDLMSYRLFSHPVHRMMQSRQKYALASTYCYVFEYDSPGFGLLKTLSTPDSPGVSHGDDLGYMFLNTITPEIHLTSKEGYITKLLIEAFTNFAFSGDPNCEAMKPVIWETINHNEGRNKCLRIDFPVTFGINSFADVLKIWDSLYEDEIII